MRKFSFWGSSAGAPAVSGQSSGAPRGVRPGVGFGLPGGLAGCRVSRGLCAVELVFGCSGASGATSLFELPPAMITAPQSRSGGLARDSSEVRFWSTVATEALDRSAECIQLCERTQAPTTPREPPGHKRHASRARGAAATPSHGRPGSTALICGVQASDRDPAARAALWLLDARPAAAQDQAEEARTTSNTRKTTSTGTGAGRSARAPLRVPPPKTGTAAHSRTGGPLLRGQRRGAAG